VLDWKTAMEENTSHFEIEKSLDGVNFTFLAQIVAVGSGANNYAVTDAQLQVGANYYRLKSVDKDGRYTYSKTILLQVTTNSIDRSLLVYPSVAQTQIQVIAAAGSIQGNAVITIYSLAGQKMTSITNRGQQPTIIDISSYSAGTYIVELVSAEVLLRTKFVKAE
jgi:Secretion system C-terminal sorting domain